jgi:hypothetical protein
MSTLTEHRGDTYTSSPPPTPPQDTGRGNRFLIALVVVLVAAVAVLGGLVISDRTSTSDTAVTDEIGQLVDDYNDAWNNWDGDAYLELVTDNAVLQTAGGETTAAQQAVMITNLEGSDWHVDTIGDPIMTGNGPWHVAQANVLTDNTSPDEGHRGISLLTIVDDNGTLRISRHVYVGPY